tara:strand:+ start:70 stop:408 length:339 start_codon:yes stop_codon:yes gene_type:complete
MDEISDVYEISYSVPVKGRMRVPRRETTYVPGSNEQDAEHYFNTVRRVQIEEETGESISRSREVHKVEIPGFDVKARPFQGSGLEQSSQTEGAGFFKGNISQSEGITLEDLK